MQTTIEIADRIAKMILASGVVVTYLLKLMAGPVAVTLLLLALLVIAIETGRIVMIWMTRD